jgi:hypothetical protein
MIPRRKPIETFLFIRIRIRIRMERFRYLIFDRFRGCHGCPCLSFSYSQVHIPFLFIGLPFFFFYFHPLCRAPVGNRLSFFFSPLAYFVYHFNSSPTPKSRSVCACVV